MKIFVNTLERFADRKARMKRILDSLGLPFEFFEGPDSRLLGRDEIAEACDQEAIRKNHGRDLSTSEIACTMAHRAIYRKMVDENIEKACILEDDILIDDDFGEIVAFLENRDFKNTVVKLDNYAEKNTPCSIWGKRRVNGRAVYKKPVTTQWMTWGYALDKRAAENLLDTWPKIEFICDYWKGMRRAVRISCIQPAVVHRNIQVASILDEDRGEVLKQRKTSASGGSKIARLLYLTKTVFLMLFS
jgi:glycosyl transferase family 25